MTSDPELQSWREQWQAGTTVPPDLRRRVERGTRNMRLMLAGEIFVTVGIGGGVTVLAAADPQTAMLVLAAAVWLFIGVAWIFAVMNRRGAWSPAAMDTASFLNLSIRRCRGRLASSSFGAGLYFVEMIFCLVWIYHDPANHSPLAAIIFAVATPAFLVGLVRYRLKTRAELAALLDLTETRQ